MQIVGEKDLPEEYQVSSDGSVDLPYIHRVQAGGLEPQDLAKLVREKLVADHILKDPSVIVTIKDTAAKRLPSLVKCKGPVVSICFWYDVAPGRVCIWRLYVDRQDRSRQFDSKDEIRQQDGGVEC